MKPDHAVHDPHRPDPMDLSRARRQREDEEAQDSPPACIDCADVEMPLGAPPTHWKCKSPKGEIHHRSPVTGKPATKREWDFCEGERSKSSSGCGPTGKWFRLKPVPSIDLDTTDAPPNPGPVVQPFAQVGGPMVAGTAGQPIVKP